MNTRKPNDPRESFAPNAEKYLTSKAHAKTDLLNVLVKRICANKGIVADVGTGAGHTAYAFAPFVEHVYAVDITEEMLAIVRREAALRKLNNITAVLGSAETLNFENRMLDGVVTRLAAHHFKGIESFVRESLRVLKDNGWLLIVDTVGSENPDVNIEIDEIESLRDPSHGKDYSVSEWEAIVKENGFSIEWIDVTRKTLDLEDWLTRMNVDEATSGILRDKILGSSGELRQYLSPQEHPPSTFDLWEMAMFARKRDSERA